MISTLFLTITDMSSVFLPDRKTSDRERVINSLNRDLPPTKEWNEFLGGRMYVGYFPPTLDIE